jgi:hypothetical protein
MGTDSDGSQSDLEATLKDLSGQDIGLDEGRTPPKPIEGIPPVHQQKRTQSVNNSSPLPDVPSNSLHKGPPEPIPVLDNAMKILQDHNIEEDNPPKPPLKLPDLPQPQFTWDSVEPSPASQPVNSKADEHGETITPRKPLKKKPVVYDELTLDELIITPNDVVIGPNYVLAPLAKKMDSISREIEPRRQKKIELEHKFKHSDPEYKHGFRSKPFARKIGGQAVPVKINNTIHKVPVTKSPVKHLKTGLKKKKKPTFSRLQDLMFIRLKTYRKRFHFGLNKIGKSTKSRAPHFYNTSNDFSTLPPQQAGTIAVQYSPSLLKLNRVSVKNLNVQIPTRRSSVFERCSRKFNSILAHINDAPVRWAYMVLPLALILILVVGIIRS